MWEPKEGEPGYWNRKLAAAITEEEFAEAFKKHKAELEKLGAKLRPYDVLLCRLLGRFGQGRMGDEERLADDVVDRREDMIWALGEIQRYLVMSTPAQGLTMTNAMIRRTYAEVEAELACAASSLMGFERSSALVRSFFDDKKTSPDARRFAALVDLSQVDEDQVETVRERIAEAIDLGIEKARNDNAHQWHP